MKLKTLKYIILILLLPGMMINVFAEENKSKNSLAKTNANPGNYRININNISTIFHNDGRSDIDGDGAFWFPKGSNRSCVYESGFLWIGKINGEILMNGSTFPSGMVAGKIGQNPEDARMYRVRPDWEKGNMDSELGDHEGTEEDIRAQYKTDWDEWPAADGAPYEDVNDNGVYDEGDIPGYPGADQTIFFIANASDAGAAQAFYGSPPMDVELHVTVWGYKSTGPLGNMIFRRYELYNKGVDDIEECYVSMWSDPDVGNAGDDFVGCDTTLSLGFAYNAFANDAIYEDAPPATGFDFFQGPMVEGAPTDTAISGGIKHPGMKNLGLTAFYYFVNENNTPYSDPDLDNYNTGTLYFWNLVRGRIPQTGELFPIPDNAGGGSTKFPLSGDPVTGTGYLDGTIKEAKDRRYGQASGPFLLKAGDKQEIVVAQIAAGAKPGVNNIQAVQLLKAYDQVAQLVYDNGFEVAKAPVAPIVTYSELDEKIVLNWGDDREAVEATESHNQQEYAFQGYNVYQLPSLSATKDEATLITTLDKADGIKIILDSEFNPEAGVDLDVVVQKGTDSGVRNYFILEKDYINNVKFNNGSKYYFAVSAYAYNPNDWAIPKTLESPLIKVTVTPQKFNPGVVTSSVLGDKVEVTKTAGASDGTVEITVVEPEKVTGHNYEVNFTKNQDDEIVWNLVDKTLNKVLLSEMTNQSGNSEYPVVDGLLVQVAGPPNDFKNFLTVANANGPIDPPTYAAFAFNSSGFPHPTTGDRPDAAVQQANGSTWGIHTNDNEDPSYTYFISRTTRNGWVDIVPYDFEIRFTAEGSYGFEWWDTDQIRAFKLPFELWNIGIATPDDPSDDYKMFCNFWDYDASNSFGLVKEDGKYLDHHISGADNDPWTDVFYWRKPDDTTPGTKGYDDLMATLDLTNMVATNDDVQSKSHETISRFTLVNWNGLLSEGVVDAEMPEEGTVIRIITNKANLTDDVFTFTAPTVGYDNEVAKEDVKEINVFPNPYYGVNPEEINKYQRFVTFSHLPNRATLRIFNLAGQSVRTIEKDDASQFIKWDLKNGDDLPVGSGVYVVYIDMPDVGTSKILKVAIIQEQQILDRF